MRVASRLLYGFHSLGFWNANSALSPRQLTVLNYHRINDPQGERAYFKPNVSATPDGFKTQIDYLQQHYTVVSLGLIERWLAGKEELPPRAALITFDDGYYDNYLNAYPELKRRGLPAVIFLATGFIDNVRPFYWDLLAYVFNQSSVDFISDNVLGEFTWTGGGERERVVRQVVEILKTLPEGTKNHLVGHIVEQLDVAVPDEEFSGMFLTWQQVREMAENGIEFGAHTVNHPILSRISQQEAETELSESKCQIESELGRKVTSFAYPNGQVNDFSKDTVGLVRDIGYQTAFTLLPGPTRYKTLKAQPFTIRRVFLSHRDDLSRFAAKLNGVPRLLEIFGSGM